jgi:hypothetical protein
MDADPNFNQQTKKKAAPRRRAQPKGTPPRTEVVRKKSGPAPKHDWIKLRTVFIEGQPVEGTDDREWLTMTEMSKRFGVHRSALYEKAGEEQWMAQREAYQFRIAKQRQARRIAMLAKESEHFDLRSIEVAKSGMDVVTTRLREIHREIEEQAERREVALGQMARGEAFNQFHLGSIIDAKEIDTLAKAARTWQEIGQKATGSDVIKVDIAQTITQTIDVDVEVTSIASELGRDDPERLAAFLQAAKRAGILDSVMNPPREIEPDEDGVVDAEIVDEGAA